jgi:spore coat polysaccharide biosynthesis protein SpsF
MGSSRLPEKILLPVLDKQLLKLTIERINQSKFVEEVILLIPDASTDDILESFAIDEKIKFFRGNEKNCLDRHYQAAKYFDIDVFAKTTSDCCLIDSRVIDEVIELYFSKSPNCDYVSNICPPTFPDGLDIEVFNFSTLEKTWELAKSDFDKEHTTTFIRNNPNLFKIINHEHSKSNLFKKHRWCLDFEDDYLFIKTIFEKLYLNNNNFSMENILELLDNNKEINMINSHLLKHNTVHSSI